MLSFCCSTSSAPSSYPGAINTSMNCSFSRSASCLSTGRLRAITPPNADIGSQAKAAS